MMGDERKLFELIEKRLDQALHPVNPEENYVSRLNTRLLSHPRISIERHNTLKIVLFLCFAFVTGFMIVILINEIFGRGNENKAA